MEKPIVASELISALSNPSRGIASYVNGKYAVGMAKHTQIQILQSQKFVLSDNMINHAVAGSYVKPKYLYSALLNCIPPFSNMWIEWDEHKRVQANHQEMIKLHGKENCEPLQLETIPQSLGYHITKVNGRMLYTCYYKTQQDRFYCPEMGFDINSDGGYSYEKSLDQWKGQNPNLKYITEEEYQEETIRNGIIMLGEGYCKSFDSVEDSSDIVNICRNLIPTQTASTHWHRSAQLFLRPIQHEDSIKHHKDLTSLSGDARFLISLLNILNYDLVTTESVMPPRKINHIYMNKSVPKNEYKIVEIDLPKPRGKKIYNKIFTGQGSPKRLHWRRGHWRRITDRKGNTVKRTWIEEQKVGNPQLGSIIHDYVLKSRKQ